MSSDADLVSDGANVQTGFIKDGQHSFVGCFHQFTDHFVVEIFHLQTHIHIPLVSDTFHTSHPRGYDNGGQTQRAVLTFKIQIGGDGGVKCYV